MPYHIRPRLLIPAALLASLALGVFIDRLALHQSVSADGYSVWDPIVDAHTQILANYYDHIDDKTLVEGAIDGMCAQLDPYSNYFTKDELDAFDKQTHGQFSGIGVEFSQDSITSPLIVVSPIEDSPALKAGMLAGDRILKINGEPINGLSLKDLNTKISGPPNTEIKFTVLHEGDKTPTELNIKRAVINIHSIKGYKIAGTDGKWDYLIDPEHRIAYVRITNFMETTAEDLDHALLPLITSDKSLRGIILDLRFNPGGLLTAGIDVADRFLESGVIVTTRGRDGKNQFEADAKKEGTYPPIPLVVLVNEYSASASEIVAGALKDHHRAILIGNRTFGKGSVQNVIMLDNGNSALKLTTAHYYLPSGRNISKLKGAPTWGVEPDPAFLLPMTDEENRNLLRARLDSEIIRPNHPATLPVAGGTTTSAAPDPNAAPPSTPDKQLQLAIQVLVGNQTILGDKPIEEAITTRPSVTASLPPTPPAPATAPATSEPASVPLAPPATQTQPASLPTTNTRPAGARVTPNDLPNLPN